LPVTFQKPSNGSEPAPSWSMALTRLHEFEPAGLFARSLSESLALQLARKEPARPGNGGAGGKP
jgi:DNA-directed RNA polymerase specialized sigma54-like protein